MKKLLQQCKTFLARNSKLLMIFLFLFLTCIVKAQTFTITTDQDDYYPGEWVIINGSGWIPGDSVKLSITHVGDSIPNHIHAPWILVVDANGNLFDEWYVAEMELNTTLWLQAQSLSTASMYAEKVFTDASYLMVSGTVQFANGIPISGVTVKGYKDSGLTIEEGRSNSRSSDGVWSLTLSKDAVRYVVVTPPIGYSPSNVILSSPPSGGIISRISSNEFRISSGPNGGTSTGNQFILVLNNSVPAISSISPNNKCAGDAAFTLSVSGTNFIPTSTVKFNGSSRPTTYINSGLLSASINATDIAQSISASITVSNPAPGGGTSSGSTLMVKALPSAPIVESNSFVYDGNNHFVTAKVDAGEEIYWFDAPTGGNLLSEIPSLNTVGSITAYAESRNKITGCVSTTRTSITLTITARPITITADAQNKIYGDTDPVLTDKVTNGSVIPGDIASGSLTRAAGENVGSYAISKGTCTYGSNYNETFVGANLVISQRPVTITPDSGLTKVYGSPDPVFAYTSSEALISGNSFSGTLGRAAGENVAAGPYAYSLGTLSAGSNYSLTLGGSSTFIISKAPSVTTVNTNNATYDAHPHGGTATVTGVGGLSQSLLVTYSGSGTSQYGPTTSAPTNASSYNAAGSYAGDANHEPSADNKDFTIAPAQATITVAGYTGVYDASPHGASPTSVLGAPEDDLRSFVSLGESFTNVPGGTAHWSFSNPNYISQSGDVAISISKTTSFTEVTITGAPFTYTGSAIMPASVSVTGAGGLNLTPDPVYADNFNAGTATASYSYAGDANHEPSSDSETFTIGKAASATVVSISGAPFTYTGSAIMPASVSVTGAGGLNLTPDPVYADNINAGTATASYPYAGDANHEPSSDSETFTIGKANAIILVTPYTVTYDGLSHKAAFSATGVEPIPADLSSLIDISATEHTNAASYPNDAWSFAGNENYNAASGTVSDAIAKANAVISVTPYSITYDGLTHKAVFSAAGVEPAPADLSSLLDISATEHTNAGIYSADAWSFAGNENYNSAGGTINDIIGQRSITITADAKSKTYGDTDPALTAQVTSGTIVGSDAASGTLARAAGENVGAYAISKATYTYGINYNETFVGDNLVIGQRPITITADAKSKTYGDTDPALTAQVTSGTIVGSDAASGTLARAAGENVGAYAISKATYTYGDNYTETFVGDNLVIGQRPITITADAKSKTYGDTDPALTAQVTSGTIVGSDAASGTLARAAGENVGAYAISKATYTYGSNYNETFVGDNLVIGQRPITITTDAKSKTYGDTDPALTAQVTSGTIVGSDAASGTLARAAGENVGAYAISKATYTYGSNYNETFVGDNLVIGQRPITITVDANQFKYCGQADPLPFGYSISGRGLAGGDACAGALQRSTGECSNFYPINIGSHTIVCGSINKESNYAITFNSANFEIKGVSIDASASSTPVQLGSVPQLKAKITPEVAGVLVNFNVESGNGTNTVYSVKTDPSGLANIGGTGLTSVDVYKVIASIGDNCTSSTAAYLAVYDPSGGFVTGGGWINSPAGAYKSNGNLTGKANFGFNSKYQKGKNIPDGNTEFQFQAGNLNFSSSTYSLGSLVISGAKATYRGVGTINGSGNYAFMVSVIDGNITGGGGYDKFRIKIWNANDVIYDNNMGLDENEVPTISLGGGSIVIHNDKTKSAEIPQIQLTGEQNVVSCNVVVPNGFSPNGDGLNDYFKISCLQDYPDAALKIYTPAGKLVFEQQRYGNLSFWGSEDAAWWNGCIGSNTSGAALPSGSYVYILELNPLKKEAVKTGVVFINK